MEITGYEIIAKDYTGDVLGQKRVLKLTPADLKAQLKPNKGWRHGDTLWVEVVVDDYLGSGRMRFKHDSTPLYIPIEDIITVFPSEPEEKVKEELPDEIKYEAISTLDKVELRFFAEKYNALLKVVKEMREKK